MRPQRAVSVLLIHGTADPLVPFRGGIVGSKHNNKGTVLSAQASTEYWVHADGLKGALPSWTDSGHKTNDSGDIHASRETWGPDEGPQVSMIPVVNGGHVEASRAELSRAEPS